MRGDVSKSSPPKPGFSSLCERCSDGRAQEGVTVKAAKTESSSKMATGADCIINMTLTTKQQRRDHVVIILSMQFVFIALSALHLNQVTAAAEVKQFVRGAATDYSQVVTILHSY